MAAAAASRAIGAKLGLREIRIHLCQRSPGSQGVRDFIEKRYVELKKANPDLPILIRECSDVQPKLWARYGKEVTHPLPQVPQASGVTIYSANTTSPPTMRSR
ncbi:PREDICTED: NADH dehydrogenase [ubiquinone] 1 alpha subcomplex subunit 2 isoform X1 [Mandrillus leucophaeus]|uniref:NADH dehydrogenase [ubiquinone] 1 alpha subcomplex subunit 2 isoform X1 n=1 Tax=Mandrillus leucophaeus TaxID=9568 RepID=UPI0005F4827E|nr:PREDICTED: NADH dehydrogenase [ubiquinone] 1 alpha subcomplex subunit 2 isoform X1 [Mandrillus leucophaeus]